MVSKPARALRIKYFRGSTTDLTIEFDSRKKLTLIYGENSSGKTTICDALDFIANREVGSLVDRGLGQLHPFWPSSGKSAADVLVELTLDGTTWIGRAKARSVSITPADTPTPRVEVLRRAALAKFIVGDPRERYAALRPFIDLSKIEQSGKTLRAQIDSSSQSLETAANRIAENIETLRRMMTQAGATGVEPLAWARALGLTTPTDVGAASKSLLAVERRLDALVRALDAARRASEEAAKATSALTSATTELEQSQQSAEAVDATLVALLEAAEVHLSMHSAGEPCPLCESTDRTAGLAERVKERLAAAQGVRSWLRR